jgi:hypothetical protein
VCRPWGIRLQRERNKVCINTKGISTRVVFSAGRKRGRVYLGSLKTTSSHALFQIPTLPINRNTVRHSKSCRRSISIRVRNRGGGGLSTSRTVFVRCMYEPMYDDMCGSVCGVCTVHRATHSATYGLKHAQRTRIYGEKQEFDKRKKKFWYVHVGKPTHLKLPPMALQLQNRNSRTGFSVFPLYLEVVIADLKSKRRISG